MALVYVGAASAGYLGATANNTLSLSSLTGGVDTQPREGDVVVAILGFSSSRGAPYFVTAGYTQEASLFVSDTYSTQLVVGTKRMGATPDTSIEFIGSGSTIRAATAIAHVWRNVDSSTLLDVAVTTASSANTGLANPPSITPATSGAVILAIGYAGTEATRLQNPGSYSNFVEVWSNDSYDSDCCVGSVSWSSGAYDPPAYTLSGADSAGNSWAAVTLALRPAVMAEPSPGDASLTITSSTPALILSSPTVSPDSAILNIDADAPSVGLAYVLSPGPGSPTITGEIPALVVYENLYGQPASAGLALSGQAPTAQATGNAYPSPGSATVSIDAAAPLPVEGHLAFPGSATLTLDESATNAVQNELPRLGAATATITGYQITLQRLFSANTESGALAITGAAPSLLESVATVMQPAAAALAITGQAPVIDSGVVPIPSSSALTASGVAPALRLDMVCGPGAGSVRTNWLVTADGTTPVDGGGTADGIVIQTAPTVLVSDHAIAQPGAGSAAVTGQAPSAAVTTGVWSEPSAGSASITGQQPTVAQTTSQYPSPNPCTITVECIGPTPVVGTVIGVPVATVAITSSAPSVVADANLVISGEAPVIGVAGPGNMVMSVIRLYGSLDGGRDVRLKWPEN